MTKEDAVRILEQSKKTLDPIRDFYFNQTKELLNSNEARCEFMRLYIKYLEISFFSESPSIQGRARIIRGFIYKMSDYEILSMMQVCTLAIGEMIEEVLTEKIPERN